MSSCCHLVQLGRVVILLGWERDYTHQKFKPATLLSIGPLIILTKGGSEDIPFMHHPM